MSTSMKHAFGRWSAYLAGPATVVAILYRWSDVVAAARDLPLPL